MHSDLIAKLEALDGPDREVDRAILAWLGFSWRGMNYWHHDNKTMWPNSAQTNFTASLDAAVALVERVLPRRDWIISSDNEAGEYKASVATNGGGFCAAESRAKAIALLIAALKALEARDG